MRAMCRVDDDGRATDSAASSDALRGEMTEKTPADGRCTILLTPESGARAGGGNRCVCGAHRAGSTSLVGIDTRCRRVRIRDAAKIRVGCNAFSPPVGAGAGRRERRRRSDALCYNEIASPTAIHRGRGRMPGASRTGASAPACGDLRQWTTMRDDRAGHRHRRCRSPARRGRRRALAFADVDGAEALAKSLRPLPRRAGLRNGAWAS